MRMAVTISGAKVAKARAFATIDWGWDKARCSCHMADQSSASSLLSGFARGARVIWWRILSISMNSSAIRRSESATIGGVVLVVDTTDTLTAIPWTSSSRRQKSPSPEKQYRMIDTWRKLQHIKRKFHIHIALDPPPSQIGIGKFTGQLSDHSIAIVIKPVD